MFIAASRNTFWFNFYVAKVHKFFHYIRYVNKLDCIFNLYYEDTFVLVIILMFSGKSTVEHAKQLSTDLAKVTNSTIV